ncbi:4-hydroxy-tetrahydrodipicolinate synthase [Frateuria aurantia]
MRGSICAIATPFLPDGGLDLPAFAAALDAQLAGGTQGLVVAGSTGEAHLLDEAEYDRLLAFACERVAGRIPVYAGTGEAATAKTVALTRRAAAAGVDGALVVTPYYLRPTQEGLRRHFLTVADAGTLPILLYNVPPRTGCDLLPETLEGLRGHPRILGIKEAVGDAGRMARLIELAGEEFVYLSGDDGTAILAMLAGAAGTISVVANLVPQLFRQLCDAAVGGNESGARHYQMRLQPLIDALNGAPNPIAVKSGLSMLGLGTDHLRLPLLALEKGPARDALEKALKGLVSAI